MRAAVKQMDLSARAYHRVLKLARTIADLAGEEQNRVAHLAKALQGRPKTTCVAETRNGSMSCRISSAIHTLTSGE